MFREMRRKAQALSPSACQEILRQGTSGVLALHGDEGYPYAVPLSYLYKDGKVYFHCAVSGHKLDALARCDKASFCVVAQDQVVPEEFTTYYRSVILFGRVRELEAPAEKREAIELLAEKYSPGQPGRAQEIQDAFARLCMLELTIEHMTGKEAKELAARR